MHNLGHDTFYFIVGMFFFDFIVANPSVEEDQKNP